MVVDNLGNYYNWANFKTRTDLSSLEKGGRHDRYHQAAFKAAYGKFAIGAYNINNLEQTMGLFQGNMDSQAPFIIQISKGARSYTHKSMLEGLIRAADSSSRRPFSLSTWTMGTNSPVMTASAAVFTPRS